MAVVFSATNEVIDPILADVVRANQNKVVSWLQGESGAWGFLAGQAIVNVRESAGRDLESKERRLIWSRMWWWLEQISAGGNAKS
jgi:hypothetical protein|tara:strand:- start:272 stop:526 length:255 start_codon:yes stop_codon:yes gene_type:complete